MLKLCGILAKPDGGVAGIPRTIQKPILAGYAAEQGALVFDNGDGNWTECSADPAQIGGVALTPGGADTTGFNILGRKEYPPLALQAMTLESPTLRFLFPYIGIAVPTPPGLIYGATRDTDGVWKVDFNKVDGEVFIVLGFPDRSPSDAAGAGQDVLVEVKFNPGIAQLI